VGASGRLLRAWLTEAHLLSTQAAPGPLSDQSGDAAATPAPAQSPLFANALCCWPARVDLKPTEEELRACRPHLEATLAYARPRYILAVGGVALNALVPGAVVSVDRGKMYRARGFWGEAWCMGTFHPAAVLRDPRLAYIARQDVLWFSFWTLGQFEPWEGARGGTYLG